MIQLLRRSLGLGVLFALLLVPSAGGQDDDSLSVLVFSKTNGYRHAAIPTGITALRELGAAHGLRIVATQDSTAFRSGRLSGIDVVVFLNTTGNVLGPRGQEALRTFVENGGGFVGVHAASDTEYDWNWYGRLIGAYFDGHPAVQEATVRVETRTPSTRMLPNPWIRRDEWYDFRSNPRDEVQVLLTLDESTYDGGTMGDDHPIAWRHTVGDGRAWYTAGGHTHTAYRSRLFRQHLLGGLRWAAGRARQPGSE
ncbi:MAG: ThuA domain-containing protein [Salinibacter sp.]